MLFARYLLPHEEEGSVMMHLVLVIHENRLCIGAVFSVYNG